MSHNDRPKAGIKNIKHPIMRSEQSNQRDVKTPNGLDSQLDTSLWNLIQPAGACQSNNIGSPQQV